MLWTLTWTRLFVLPFLGWLAGWNVDPSSVTLSLIVWTPIFYFLILVFAIWIKLCFLMWVFFGPTVAQTCLSAHRECVFPSFTNFRYHNQNTGTKSKQRPRDALTPGSAQCSLTILIFLCALIVSSLPTEEQLQPHITNPLLMRSFNCSPSGMFNN